MLNGLTIGIPVYNEEKLIERAIRSAAPQCEYLVVADNSSTDGTQDVCERLRQEFPNMVYVRHERNLGARENWNFIIKSATTRFLMFLGSHDYIDSDYVRVVIGVFDKREDLQGAMGRLCFDYEGCLQPVASFNGWRGGLAVSSAHRVWSLFFDRAHLGWMAYGIFKTDVYRRCFTDDLPDYGIDVIFLSRVLELGPFEIVDGPCYNGWMREDAGKKADYLHRVSARRHDNRQRLKLRNEFRVAQYEMVARQFLGASNENKWLLRLVTMVRFGVFRKPGIDLVYFVLYIPAKLFRKFPRLSRWLKGVAEAKQ